MDSGLACGHVNKLLYDVATMFYLCLIVDFAPVDSCVVRRYKTFQIVVKF